MFDSLPYRNDAALVFRRLIRSLPTRAGVLGVATCDKGLPAMMMALASMHDLPGVLVPGGVTLPPIAGEDTAKVQTLGEIAAAWCAARGKQALLLPLPLPGGTASALRRGLNCCPDNIGGAVTWEQWLAGRYGA